MSEAWDRAVEAGARAMVMQQTNGCCDEWPKPCQECDCFRDNSPDVWAGYERSHACAVLAARLPVLLEALAEQLAAEEREMSIAQGAPRELHYLRFGLRHSIAVVGEFAAEVQR